MVIDEKTGRILYWAEKNFRKENQRRIKLIKLIRRRGETYENQ